MNIRDRLIERWGMSRIRGNLINNTRRAQKIMPPFVLKGIRFLFWNILFGFISLPLYYFLTLYQLVSGRKIIFYGLVFDRIGHLALETEMFYWKTKDPDFNRDNNIYIGFGYQLPASNRQLLKMYQRKIPIINSMLFEKLMLLTFFRKSKYVYIPCFSSIDFLTGIINRQQGPTISFNHDEQAKGGKILGEMGIGEKDWFVCFFARDHAYLGPGSEHHDHRNSNIDSYLLAAEYIADQGGYAIRMGAKVDKPLSSKKSARIIDYAIDFRSDFMDIYLLAHCKFMLGANSGIACVPAIFGVPVANANVLPIALGTFGNKALYIHKKLRQVETGKYLTFPEIFNSNLATLEFMKDYKNAGVEFIDNSPEEILELTKEMLARVNGKDNELSREEMLLRERYNGYIKPEHPSYDSPAKIAVSFLRTNVDLMEML